MAPASEPSQATHLHYLRQALSLARQSPPKPTNFRVGCVIVSFAASPSTGSDGAATTSNVKEGVVGGGEAQNENDVVMEGEVLSTGYTLELEGNTHAEQNALTKLAHAHGILSTSTSPSLSSSPSDLALLGRRVLTPERNVYLYTTLEPCGKRLSGNTPCVQRIVATRDPTAATGGGGGGGIRKVVFGAREPGTFVQDSQSLQMLDAAGVPWEYVAGMEEEILRVAKEGHVVVVKEEGGSSRDTPTHSHAQGPTNVDDISPEERRRQEALPRNPKKRMMEVDVPQ
ncbi:uncharacterized protein PV07_01324 [Cladophialophora immunda]|uniref:CMP/dCMP-type deaminase domain-containing protein n=1 Tax=Cladophialophora immunda TaxID=569365 RepID=A0A0D2BAH8_9EURO|nr:uncharacterized protein PV07_01324 [Cladophialophora immunda]KIW34547.1 hypothetical protein PV07_01324 [Cladophialophora immunda]